MKIFKAAARIKNLSADEASKHKKLFSTLRLCYLLPILLLAVFCWSNISIADDSDSEDIKPGDVIINEVMYDPEGTDTGKEWIELYNTTSKTIDMTGYELYPDGIGYFDFPNFSLESNSYITIHLRKDGIASNYDLYQGISPKNNMSNTAGSIAIFIGSKHNKDTILDFVQYGKDGQTWESTASDADIWTKGLFAPVIDEDYSLSRKNTTSNNFEKSLCPGGTPGQENSAQNDCDNNNDNNSDNDNDDNNTNEKSSYAGKIKINEIYPAPDTQAGEKEFLEIINVSNEEIDLDGWTVEDAANHKVSFPKKTLTPKELLSLEGDFKFNNTSADTATVLDSHNRIVDSKEYEHARSTYAYAFDGSAWRWTSHPTPGEENVFDKMLSGKIIKDKPVYKNIYADFEVETDRDAKKFTWDFGDGHKSYLQKTKHKYTKTGTYEASLKITGDGEDALYNFTVTVEKYKAPKVRITKVSPNPKGSDTENEWMEIKNSSKKKINLKGWSMATGWDNLYNHPIREDFIIKAGKTKRLGRDICAFTLANTKTKIELRDPSGKVVQKITYDNGKKAIAEDALYQKETGSSWKWSVPVFVGTGLVSAQNDVLARNVSSIQLGQTQGLSLQIESDLIGKYSLDPAWQEKQNYRLELAAFNSALKIPASKTNQPRILGARIVPYDGNYYVFTRKIIYTHWAVQFSEYLWLEINSKLNRVLNKI